MKQLDNETMLVSGAGEMGTCLDKLLSLNHKVLLWDKQPEKRRPNQPLEKLLPKAGIIFLTIPSSALRPVLETLKPNLRPEQVLVCLSKGMEPSGKTVAQIIQKTVPNDFVLFFGPSLAEELNAGQPGWAVAATNNKSTFARLTNIFSGTPLQLEYSQEVKTIAFAGAMKNAYAALLGIADGLKLGFNTKGALISYILQEWEKLALILELNREALFGRAGEGDLLATGLSPNSRNRLAGETLITQGKILEAESVNVIAGLSALIRAQKQELPPLLSLLRKAFIGKQPPDQKEFLTSFR